MFMIEVTIPKNEIKKFLNEILLFDFTFRHDDEGFCCSSIFNCINMINNKKELIFSGTYYNTKDNSKYSILNEIDKLDDVKITIRGNINRSTKQVRKISLYIEFKNPDYMQKIHKVLKQLEMNYTIFMLDNPDDVGYVIKINDNIKLFPLDGDKIYINVKKINNVKIIKIPMYRLSTHTDL